jgi:uncharacterized membrane-anchored protein YhcB (DUF1043 family)
MRQKFVLLLSFWALSLSVAAQECTLGIGGRDTDLIIQVFGLSDGQQQQLQAWAAALEAENAPLEAQARTLLDTHPQSTTEELAALGHKYQQIKDAMLENARRYDRLLLGTFSERQYQRYAELCREVGRQPMSPLAEAPKPGQPPR